MPTAPPSIARLEIVTHMWRAMVTPANTMNTCGSDRLFRVRHGTWTCRPGGHVHRHHPNRKLPPAVLLRESYREGGRVKKRTLANLSKLPQALIAGIAALLDGGMVSGKRAAEPGFEIVRSLPHGHVAAVQAMIRKLGLERTLAGRHWRRQAAVEVLEGNASDPQTIREQIDKLKRRFKLSHVALVGDRGMITSARITEELAPRRSFSPASFPANRVRFPVSGASRQTPVVSVIEPRSRKTIVQVKLFISLTLSPSSGPRSPNRRKA